MHKLRLITSKVIDRDEPAGNNEERMFTFLMNCPPGTRVWVTYPHGEGVEFSLIDVPNHDRS